MLADCIPNRGGTQIAPRLLAWAAAAVCLTAAVGCVQRRLTIRTNPPGALVYVDNYEIGTTPVSADFIYYGRRQIRLEKPGYETLTIEQPIPAPWYQWFPLDFVTENLVPGEIRDERVVDYQLVPQRMIPPEEILARGEQLRRSVQPAAYAAPQPLGGAPYGGPAGTAAPYAAPPGGAIPYGAPPSTPAPNNAIPQGGGAPAIQLRPQYPAMPTPPATREPTPTLAPLPSTGR